MLLYSYSDEEEEVKICEDLLFTQRSSSSSFQQRDDKKCANTVIDACYEYAAQKLKTDLFSSGISYKGIIVEEEIVSGDHDVGEGEQRDSDQLLSSDFY